MAWTVEYIRERGVAVARMEGDMAEEDLLLMARELFVKAGEFGLKRFLVDDRHLRPVLPTATIHKLPALFCEAGLQKCEPVAIVHAEDAGRHQDWRFFETVAHNQGFNVKLFPDSDQALRWLDPDSHGAQTPPEGSP